MPQATATVTLKGNPVTLLGNDVPVGQSAPDCTLVANDLSEFKLSSLKGKKVILSVVPSLDTAVCDLQTKRFNQEATALGNDVVVLTISMDLPFAQKRWCGAAGVTRVQTLSDYREAAFGKAYGVLIGNPAAVAPVGQIDLCRRCQRGLALQADRSGSDHGTKIRRGIGSCNMGKSKKEASMAFTVPDLAYGFEALEPHIDTQTMQIHHGKHHAAYVNNLNKATEGKKDFEAKSIEDLVAHINAVPENIRTAVRNNGGGHYNHSLFWETIGPKAGGQPTGELADAIKADLGGFDAFKEKFTTAATTRFGSGWAWLIVSNGKLRCLFNPNQDNPLMDVAEVKGKPILRDRRLGTRLLPEIPEPPSRLHRRFLERDQLERGR